MAIATNDKLLDGAGVSRLSTKVKSFVNGKALPSGGTAGKVLVKQSATDYDADWEDLASSGVTIYGLNSGDFTIQLLYTTEVIYFVDTTVLSSYIISTTGKTVAEAESGDLVWCTSQSDTYDEGIYVIDKYDTFTANYMTYTGFILKQYMNQPSKIGYFPRTSTSDCLKTSNRTQSITTSTTNVPSTNAVKNYVDSKLVPSGGTAGQVLSKKSGTDYDTEWTTPSGGGSSEDKYYLGKYIPIIPDKSPADKTWNGLTAFWGWNVWTDGTNIYYSNGSQQYILDKATSTWSTKTWYGLTNFSGMYVWTDGTNIYYSYGSQQYKLNSTTSRWDAMNWTGLTSFNKTDIWTDGTNIYYSDYNDGSYVLNLSNSTWSVKTGFGTDFYGRDVWTDGNNIYLSDGNAQYVLNDSGAWVSKTWTGLSSFYGRYIWTDGKNIYSLGDTSNHKYILDKDTSTWTYQWIYCPWEVRGFWTDGDNIYYSFDEEGDPSHKVYIKSVKNNIKLKPIL